MFAVKQFIHKGSILLNICDSDLLGKTLVHENHQMKISENYYGQKIVEQDEAESLLKHSSNINMVGKKTISLSVSLGIGDNSGIKEINGVPFLIVFNM